MKKFSLLVLSLACAFAAEASDLELCYRQPAKVWTEALPLGNSRLGAMVFGDPAKECIQLNEETFWGGSPHDNNVEAFGDALPVARKLVLEGKEKEAAEVLNKINIPHNGMPYLTVGNLILDFPGHENYTGYKRLLDIERAVQTTEYSSKGVAYRRETFASFTRNVIIMRITADREKSITFTAGYNTPLPKHSVAAKGNRLILKGTGTDHEGVAGLVRFENRTQIDATGGKVKAEKERIVVTGATSVTILISIATNFIDYDDISADEGRRAESWLKSASGIAYGQMLAEHVEYYRKQFGRVSLNVGRAKGQEEDTHVRIRNFKDGNDPGLVALMFQFGRYLLISSSQPGGQPANLQGIWNDQLSPPWDSKYTININAQMNYWPAEATNLGETHEPLFRIIRDLSVTGQKTAKIMYGSRGWCAHHNTDLWRIAGPVDKPNTGMWPTGGAWLGQHIWQHYLYTGDKAFLREYYPALKGAADFLLGALAEHPRYGWLTLAPSVSPEQGPQGSKTNIVAGATMDNQIAFDALSSALYATKILDADDGSYAGELERTVARLAPMQIGRHNQLQEWLADVDDPQNHHRHISHLYGLYPGNQISPYTSPTLFQAAKNSLLYRGDMATGWSIGWKINLWARLLDGNHAYKIIANMLTLVEPGNNDGRTYHNMFDAHPPFQIDGNFGFTAGVAEMLLQSHDGAVHLLPAIPDVWKKGEVRGLMARGGFEVSMTWDGNELSEVSVVSRLGGNLRLRSYVPLSGQGLTGAKGRNPNPLYVTADIGEPLTSKEIDPQYPLLLRTYEYDVDTQPGRRYTFSRGR
ncbi:MAG: glycoside hydrolase N-terminal domain-containing protein [Rikenellaceae bacterium]|jgi:alpha-L-fucosidase 2|nr:glycoside hydrolase N-terminal domain-containing protein [Rikenellaceae bacterium]